MDIVDSLRAQSFAWAKLAADEIERLLAFEQRVELAVIPWLADLDDAALTPTERIARAVEAMRDSKTPNVKLSGPQRPAQEYANGTK